MANIFDQYGQGLAGAAGSVFGYGTQNTSAADQLAAQGAMPAQINTAESEQDRQKQQALLAMLTAQANGTGPSAAQAQLQQGIQSAGANQAAIAAGGRYGGNAQLRQQQVGNATAQIEAGGANQAAQLRANQMNAGAQEASGAAGTLHAQDAAGATAQAQLQQQYNQQVGGLYGAEQGQQAQEGMALQKSVLNALGGGLMGGSGGSTTAGGIGKALMMAHGGRASVPETALVGEHGPELAHLEPGSVVAPLNAKDKRPGSPTASDVLMAHGKGDPKMLMHGLVTHAKTLKRMLNAA
jgi:hypothetical protein